MKKSIITTAIAALALAGCTGEENTSGAYVPEGTPIRVNAYVGDMQTRAGYTTETPPKGFYLKIDKKKASKYNYDAWMSYDDATGWSSFDATNTTTALPMYWAGDGEQVEVTAATFPASEMTTGVAVESDQTSEDNLNSSDKLRMKATPMNPDPNGITVTLTHLMAKVKLEIDLGEDDDYQTNPLTKVTIGGTELKRTCEETTTGYEFTDLTASTVGDITPYTGAFTATTKTTTSKTNAKARYEAILVPQTAKAGTFTVSLTLEGGKEFLWTAGADVELKSNYEYTLNLRLYGDKLLLGDVSVDAWGSDKLDGGVVEAYIPTFTATEAGHLDAVAITKALKGGTKLKIVGPLNATDVKALQNNDKITYLDLTEATAADGYSVNNISFNGTTLADKLETIKLPETMTSIGLEAFMGCTTLTEVELPAGLTSILSSAFEGCTALTNVTLPTGLTTMKAGVFQKTAIKEIDIPAGVKLIDGNTFTDCKALTKVTFNGNVETIGDHAFEGCSALTEISLPSTVKSIGKSAFEDCSTLTSIVWSADLEKIDSRAFAFCKAITSIAIPSKVEEIGDEAFTACESLAEITIPSKVTAIAQKCFQNCIKLTKVTCEGTVERIGQDAFDSCKELEYLYLEKCTTALPTLGTGAFSDIGKGETINVYLSDDFYTSIDNGTVSKWSGNFDCNFNYTTRSREE